MTKEFSEIDNIIILPKEGIREGQVIATWTTEPDRLFVYHGGRWHETNNELLSQNVIHVDADSFSHAELEKLDNLVFSNEVYINDYGDDNA
jgi:hypothetical protein